MKSILFVVLIAIAISSSFAALIKGSCPKPEQPKADNWVFNNFLGSWTVLGRSEDTEPATVYNTLELYHLYPGKVAVIEKGNARDSHVRSLWDKYITMTVGDFDGESYYDISYNDNPYYFTFKTSEGHRGQFWMPYYARPKYAEGVIASCVQIDESTMDVKAWFVSKTTVAADSTTAINVIKSVTGQKYIEVCQGSFC